jgi:hypothetical protein
MLPLRTPTSRSSSQGSGASSPTLFSKKKWTEWSKEQSLQLPTSLPIRYTQKLRIPSRKNLILLILFIFAALSFITRRLPSSNRHRTSGRAFRSWKGIPYYGHRTPHYTDGVCRLDMSTLEQYGLTKDFSYTRRYVEQVPFERGPNPRANLAWVDELNEEMFNGIDHLSFPTPIGEVVEPAPVHHGGPIVDLSRCSPTPLKMHLRQLHKPVDAKHLVFGMATTSERLLEYAATQALWLANTGARLVVIVPTGPKVQELRDHLARLSIQATVLTSNDEFLVNYFKLIEAFHAHGDNKSKWFTFIDDDTHYFSMKRFVDALNIYNPDTEVYLGNPSEDLRQMRYEGLFAFGGAGVTVSRGLLNHLHGEYYGCLAEQQPWEPGDVRVKHCVYQHTETKLTMIEGLHQLDLIGESIGLLEGPRPPITWHHYRSWSPQPVDLISRAGQICDGACLFQRWKFPVPSDFGYAYMTFHFGVSIVGYSVGIRPDLSKTESTWVIYPESNFDHSIAPLRMGLQEGRDRFTYRLKGISDDVDGHVKHTYIKYVDREKQRLRNEKMESLRANGTASAMAELIAEESRNSTVSDVDEVMELIFI